MLCKITKKCLKVINFQKKIVILNSILIHNNT